MTQDYKKYICLICGFIYDEEQGWPEDGIPAGTRWEEVSDTWCCPDCGASKEDFEMMQISD
ncbi:MAG: rubredoxin [Proteobacteria bacterium]|nr:rubredoxin [Pseudomonadota bacterium]